MYFGLSEDQIFFQDNVKKFLEDNDHTVIDNLKEDDIDIILLINPLRFSEISTFDHFDIYKYLNEVNNKAIVVQRINECDERKNTKGVNNQIIYANNFTDYTVFISGWLKKLYSNYKEFSNSSIILLLKILYSFPNFFLSSKLKELRDFIKIEIRPFFPSSFTFNFCNSL